MSTLANEFCRDLEKENVPSDIGSTVMSADVLGKMMADGLNVGQTIRRQGRA
jgi:hypothetical protein